MTTISVKAKAMPYSVVLESMWVDDTRTCETCDGRGQMALRRSHHLLDIYFVECAQCNGSGVAGSFHRLL